MINKNYLNMLGLANAARALVNGETLIKSISANKVELVLIANDASDNTKKKITDKCQFYHVVNFIVDDIETISKAIVNIIVLLLVLQIKDLQKKLKK